MAATRKERKSKLKAPSNCRLRAVREQLGLSLNEVAKAVGISNVGLYQIECGHGTRLGSARKLSAFYGKSIDELWPTKGGAT